MICNHLIKEGYEDVFQVDTHARLAVVQLALAVLIQHFPVSTFIFLVVRVKPFLHLVPR